MALRLDDMDTDEYQPIEEKDFRSTMREFSSTFRMTTNTASTGILFNQLRSSRSIDRSMVRIEEMLNYFRYKEEKPEKEMFRIDTEPGYGQTLQSSQFRKKGQVLAQKEPAG